MALQRSTLSAPACTSFNSLANSTVTVASSAAVTVGSSANVTDHEIQVTLTGPATMTGSAATIVALYAYASADGTNWTNTNNTNELIDGTDKAITWSVNGSNAKYLGSVLMHTTTSGTSIIYKSQILSLVASFGSMPSKYVIIAQNSSGAALAASGHSIAIQEIYYN